MEAREEQRKGQGTPVQKLFSGNSTRRKKLSGYRKTSTNTARVSVRMINCTPIRRRENAYPFYEKRTTTACRRAVVGLSMKVSSLSMCAFFPTLFLSHTFERSTSLVLTRHVNCVSQYLRSLPMI